MLNTLDTVIAFAVIMTVLSLLITIIVQMVSGALSLRGKNLANALALTFQTIDPALKKQAHSLAAQILRDPIFSDSILKKKDRVVKDINAATRALMVAERNFADAEKSLKETEPSLAQKKRENAAADTAAEQKAIEEAKKTRDVAAQELEKASADPTVSVPPVEPNRMGPWGFLTRGGTILGSAIRPGEIYRILHAFAVMTKTEAAVYDVPPELINASAAVLKALQKSDPLAEESHQKLEVIASMANLFDPQAKKAVVDSLANLGETVERATIRAYDRFQRWFGSGQDRAEQWFQMHVRIVTIVAAIVTAFLLQLDTGDIYRQLRDQPKLVEALVKSAPGVLEKGETVVDPGNTPAYHAYLLWLRKHPLFPLDALPTPGDQDHYRQEIKKRLATPADTEDPVRQFDTAFDQAMKVEGAAKTPPGATAHAAYLSWVENFPTYKLPPSFDYEKATKESVEQEIKTMIEKDPDKSAKPEDLIAEYDDLQTEGAYAFEKAHEKTFADLQKKLDEAGFNLVPKSFWSRWDNEHIPSWAECRWTRWIPRSVIHVFVHLLGILATAGLLALGAPFWFNLLKNLMSLRPAVATLIEKRPTSAPALPASPATPPSPS
jgi:hypothetical protein